MNTLEDRVRRALRETAEDISRTDVPPLRLPDGAGRGRLARGWRGWPSWLTPLAAAAAVAAVLAATLALTGGPARPGHRTSSDALLARAPRYYVVLTDTGPNRGWPRQAEVRATRTGRIVATLAAPRPDDAFIMAAAASGVGRYVLAAEPMALQHRKVMGPDGRPVPGKTVEFLVAGRPDPLLPAADQLIRPGLGAEPAACPGAAGRCGSRRPGAHPGWPPARGGHPATGGPRPGPEIQVDTLATGAQRVWTWPGAQPVDGEPGWHRLGAVLGGGRPDAGLCAADRRPVQSPAAGHHRAGQQPGGQPAGPEPELVGYADRRRFSHGRAVNNNDTFGALLTPDGSKIVVATVTQSLHPLTSEFAFTEFSARTGKVVAVLGRWRFIRRWPEQEQAVLWTNADGSTLLVLAHRPGVTVRPARPARGPLLRRVRRAAR